jgi:hypothetical protein
MKDFRDIVAHLRATQKKEIGSVCSLVAPRWRVACWTLCFDLSLPCALILPAASARPSVRLFTPSSAHLLCISCRPMNERQSSLRYAKWVQGSRCLPSCSRPFPCCWKCKLARFGFRFACCPQNVFASCPPAARTQAPAPSALHLLRCLSVARTPASSLSGSGRAACSSMSSCRGRRPRQIAHHARQGEGGGREQAQAGRGFEGQQG